MPEGGVNSAPTPARTFADDARSLIGGLADSLRIGGRAAGLTEEQMDPARCEHGNLTADCGTCAGRPDPAAENPTHTARMEPDAITPDNDAQTAAAVKLAWALLDRMAKGEPYALSNIAGVRDTLEAIVNLAEVNAEDRAAREQARDDATWDACRDAAAKVVDEAKGWMSNADIADAIRALRRGDK